MNDLLWLLLLGIAWWLEPFAMGRLWAMVMVFVVLPVAGLVHGLGWLLPDAFLGVLVLLWWWFADRRWKTMAKTTEIF